MLKRLYIIFKNNDIKIDEDDFIYGTFNLIKYIIFLLILIPISIYFEIFKEVVFFLFSYYLLRQYTGGIHLSSSILCMICSIIVVTSLSFLSKTVNFINIFLVCGIYCLNFLFVFFHKSIDHPNKPLTQNEISIFTRKALLTIIIYCLISAMLVILHFYTLSNIIILVTSLCSFEILLYPIFLKLHIPIFC